MTDERGDARISYAILYTRPVATGRDESFQAELREVLRHGGLRKAGAACELADRGLAFGDQGAEHEKPVFVGKQAEHGHGGGGTVAEDVIER
jgi:hypothetical protein